MKESDEPMPMSSAENSCTHEVSPGMNIEANKPAYPMSRQAVDTNVVSRLQREGRYRHPMPNASKTPR